MEKKYDFMQAEQQMQQLWEEEQVYRFDKDRAGEIYSIDTPPPTVSGSLHIGHIFSYTQAEMVARYRRMQGDHVFYPFGFDDNGLPTERLVEKEQKIRAKDCSRSEFARICRSTTEKYEKNFRDLWKSLGFSVDWSLQYETVNPQVQEISQKLFLELVDMGKAYVKESPVLWCTECQTSIAQAELDTCDVESTFNYIPFMVDGEVLEVATTRPELLYGCVCLFINPEDQRYASFIGKMARVPLYDYEIPIWGDGKVSMEKGTGVVMCATFGDSTDAEWYQEHNLPYRKAILPTGRMAGEVPFVGGQRVDEARSTIIGLLKEQGLLLKSETIIHTIAVHERCGKGIEIIPSRQWYIDILTEKERFLKAADEIRWHPEQMKARYQAWVENLKWDWCISRQRYFGVPFPVWYCRDCGKPVFADKGQLPVNPLETAYEGQCGCGCREFVPEPAVFDTWATSSITPQINSRSGACILPMSMRSHAHEIIRTWTFYTIVRSLYHTGDIPWKDLMISGFVLAKKGEKISKSKGNTKLEPSALIKRHSADVLRYWAANAKLGTDTFFSEDELTVSKRFITKLWNASKFAVMHLEDMDADCIPGAPHAPSHENLLPVDRWMIERTNETICRMRDLMDRYEVGPARHEVDDLFWKDFCDNYVEIIKERLYQPEVHGAAARASGQYALYYALLNILKLYAAYVPHITDYIYQEYFRRYEGKASIHQLLWAKPQAPDERLLRFGEELKAVVSRMRKYKSEHNLSMKTEMESLTITADQELMPYFKETEGDLKACSKAGKIIFI